MQKKKAPKLRLRRETLTSLNPQDLQDVQGAACTDNCVYTKISHCIGCICP